MTGSKKQDNRRKPITMKEAALAVVGDLQAAGFVALFAGGCVRDRLMGIEPHDYDVATSARPEEVIKTFRRTQTVGAKFGVVLVRIGRQPIEVATFRTDLDYEDGRRPVGVRFADAKEDARRRDFSINGMFYDPIRDEVVDYVGGQADITARLIRAIGEPGQRFSEDHLRLLRAVRFAARLDFVIEPKTFAAMSRHAAEIRRISPERIRMELEAILAHPRRAVAVETLHRAGVLIYLWPGAEALGPRVAEILSLLAALPPEARFELGLAAVLLGRSADHAASVCEKLRCSNATRETVGWLLRHQAALDDPMAVTLADLKLLMANEAFSDLLHLGRARLAAADEEMRPYEEIAARARAVPADEVAPPPLLTGHDLAAMGLAPGPRYKQILDRVYYAQLNEEIQSRDAALAIARRWVDQME